MTVLERLRTLPSWMLLSLAMNGLLFLAVIVSLRSNPPTPTQNGSVLPQASASVPSENVSPEAVSQLGDRQYLNYQQWVALLNQEARAAQDAPRLTVLLGDSISLWFPRELLPGRRTWLNQAISGEHSEALLQRLENLDQVQAEIFFLMIGINDLIAGKSEAQVIANIEEAMIYLKEQHPDADVVVQSILPHSAQNATWEGRERLLLLPNRRIQSVNEALAEVAEVHDVYFLDVYPLLANGEGALRLDLTTDGLHLNERGYLVWRTAIAMLLNEEFEE
ncbi:MAG: lysophospholipase [Leptolyngbya sp. SIO1D8]|nr:lysophospholipase [Leptolyngbya sp. SIO1D8]